jgi:hypothetical protein
MTEALKYTGGPQNEAPGEFSGSGGLRYKKYR